MDTTVLALAAVAAAEAVGEPAVAAAWEAPSVLEGMTVGALAGHLDAGLDRFEHLLAATDDVPPGPDRSLLEFYGGNRIEGSALESDDALHAFLRDDGAERAAAGPAAVQASCTARIDRVLAALADARPDRWVPTARVPGRTPLSVYLPTRIVELAVHTDDLLASVGIDRPPAPEVADVVLGVALELARSRHGDTAVVRAAYRGGPPVFPVL